MIHYLLPAFFIGATVGGLFSSITPAAAQKSEPTLSISSAAQTGKVDSIEPEKSKIAKEPKVIVYSAEFCSYCTSAKELLDAKNVKYDIVDVQGKKHLIDEMEKTTGQRTVPQIVINGKHIGGYLSLVGANLTGELDDLLKVKE